MEQTLTIFIAGVGGVFIAMALLYLAMRVTPLFTRWFEDKTPPKKEP
jgi:Na+-transporting methylmalonyl-CoA/oxaloacetate decarboxylase gamma subunit